MWGGGGRIATFKKESIIALFSAEEGQKEKSYQSLKRKVSIIASVSAIEWAEKEGWKQENHKKVQKVHNHRIGFCDRIEWKEMERIETGESKWSKIN